MSEAIPATRLRIKFAKQGALRYIGHLDLHHIWQRSIRRAGLPLVYSQGFHPQPKIQLASALALGFSSQAEILDIWIDKDATWEQDSLQAAVPEGIKIFDMQEVELHSPALQTQVESAEYEVTLLDEISDSLLDEKLATLMDAESILRPKRVKKRKRFTTVPPTYDLRPLILEMKRIAPQKIFMRLTTQEGATGRPDEILKEMGIPVEAARVERTALNLK
jgi:radical SAM-linked protein